MAPQPNKVELDFFMCDVNSSDAINILKYAADGLVILGFKGVAPVTNFGCKVAMRLGQVGWGGSLGGCQLRAVVLSCVVDFSCGGVIWDIIWLGGMGLGGCGALGGGRPCIIQIV